MGRQRAFGGLWAALLRALVLVCLVLAPSVLAAQHGPLAGTVPPALHAGQADHDRAAAVLTAGAHNAADHEHPTQEAVTASVAASPLPPPAGFARARGDPVTSAEGAAPTRPPRRA